MDPLTQLLVQRQIAASQSQAQPNGGMPSVPPNPQSHVPPEAQRWKNAQQLQEAYRGDWTPNPVLLRATQGK